MRAGSVDDLRDLPDLGVDDNDVRGGDWLVGRGVDVPHRRARVDEGTADHRRERSVGKARAADVPDRLRILRVEDRGKTRGEALDEDFENHVSLRESVVGTGERDIVDLDE